MKKLSKRLRAVIDMIRPADTLWDIGCDHGFVPIRAVQEGKVLYAVAADMAAGPLRAAENNIRAAGLSDKISCVLSDGFKGLKGCGRPDCVVITGMGGHLIADILSGAYSAGLCPETFSQIILGGQSDLEYLRRFVCGINGLMIREERCVYDDGKYYMLFDIALCDGHPERQPYTDAEYCYGRCIRPCDSGIYREYLAGRIKSLNLARSQLAAAPGENDKRTMEIDRQLKLVKERMEEQSYD